MICRFALLLVPAVFFAACPADAQLGAVRERLGQADTRERRPNDNVEGTIWEYEGELEKGELDGKKEASIAGKFRVEGTGIYAVGRSIRLTGKQDRKKLLEDLRNGGSRTFKTPDGTPTRIGDVKSSKKSRITLDFDDERDDPNALFGTMVLRLKKDLKNVYIGDYQEKEGKKTVRTWQMTVRKVQD